MTFPWVIRFDNQTDLCLFNVLKDFLDFFLPILLSGASEGLPFCYGISLIYFLPVKGWPLFKFVFKTRFVGQNEKSANKFAVIIHLILIFRIWLKMSKRNQMIKFELNWSSVNVITQLDDCRHGYKINIATKITPASVCHEW